METVGNWLLAFAVVLAIVDGAAILLSRLGVMSRLPGDIVIHGKNVTVYLPLGLSIVLSVVLTVVLNVVSRR